MAKQMYTLNHNGHDYNYIAHDIESILSNKHAHKMYGMVANTDGAVHSSWHSFSDETEVRNRHWHFKSDDVVLDIGAAYGSYSITAAIQGARVYAFEPNDFCRSLLTQNIEVNPSIVPLIVIVPIGIHSQSGYFEPNYNDFSLEPLDSMESFQVKKLDDIIRTHNLDRIDMIKIDVEGAELGVLKGAEQTIRKFKPRILIEEHEFKVSGIGKLCQDYIESLNLGYSNERHPHFAVNHCYYKIDGMV